eukprot:TRINITY_DN115421_c0_g1_i1.p1 TRINITY_DN115421_c0_g1~~TRINITY_DN115421_c0_g1_i1.p1  ORF type:complete len:125 (-),score=36.10 TRINITY_DN115421_c0_g1_i1:95-469(-)
MSKFSAVGPGGKADKKLDQATEAAAVTKSKWDDKSSATATATSGNTGSLASADSGAGGDDEIDPLDAFMMQNQSKVQQEIASTGTKRKLEDGDSRTEGAKKGARMLELARKHKAKQNAMRGGAS